MFHILQIIPGTCFNAYDIESSHKLLNLMICFICHIVISNSTAENIAVYIWDCLIEHLPNLYEVLLHETDKNIAIYRGEMNN